MLPARFHETPSQQLANLSLRMRKCSFSFMECSFNEVYIWAAPGWRQHFWGQCETLTAVQQYVTIAVYAPSLGPQGCINGLSDEWRENGSCDPRSAPLVHWFHNTGIFCIVLGVLYIVFVVFYIVLGVFYIVLGIFYIVWGVFYFVLGVFYIAACIFYTGFPPVFCHLIAYHCVWYIPNGNGSLI